MMFSETSNYVEDLPTNCLNAFDRFVGLALKVPNTKFQVSISSLRQGKVFLQHHASHRKVNP